MLRIFTPVNIQRLRSGLNPHTWTNYYTAPYFNILTILNIEIQEQKVCEIIANDRINILM